MSQDLEHRLRQALPPGMVNEFDTFVEEARDCADFPAVERGSGSRERYEDLGPLGTGGMGEVRRVLDRELGRTMAMKIIRSDLMERPKVLARFIEEAQCSAQLQHPGIVPVHEMGRLKDGRAYFTMAEVKGRTLSEVIAEVHAASKAERWRPGARGWTFRGLVDIFHRTCEAVAYAHSRDVVHRDIKPQNIMVGEHGEVLVVDWGLAKVGGGVELDEDADTGNPVTTDRSRDAAQATRIGAVAGTPAYMSPEQATGAVDRISAQSDVYALGAVLYEILSGRPPYAGHSAGAVLAKVRAGPPSPPGRGMGMADTLHFDFDDDPESISPDAAPVPSPPLPAELVEVCNQAMARGQADRFPDAGRVATEVAAWLAGVRLREQALAVVERAVAEGPAISDLRTRAVRLEAEAEDLLANVESWRPEEDKIAGWSKADEAAALRREVNRLEHQLERRLAGALQIDPTLPEAHSVLAGRHRADHAAAELARDHAQATRSARLLRAHAQALPDGHAVRRRCAEYLKGEGTLTLVTDPPGAEVLLHRYEVRNRRLVPVFQRSLGCTPLVGTPLSMGSYLCVLKSPGRVDVRYPVRIGRGTDWHGVPPGDREPHAVRLPKTTELGQEDCWVPAGWFDAGGDPEAVDSLSRRRVWVDGFSMSRQPVTNELYLAFLDDLVVQGREEEALLHAPRERGGIEGEVGAPIFGYENGRFSLRPDADGDVWSPDWPTLCVNWAGAAAFAKWWGQRTGGAWRLPAELEWEKAGRGVDGRAYPWGDGFDPSWCNMKASHRGRHLPVPTGTYTVDESVYGVRDMAGNAREWTATLHQANSDARDGERLVLPRDAGASDAPMVARGGGWVGVARDARLATRGKYTPNLRFSVLGFRLARSLLDLPRVHPGRMPI